MNVVSRGARLLRSLPQLHWYHGRSTYYESVINIDMSTRRAARISEREMTKRPYQDQNTFGAEDNTTGIINELTSMNDEKDAIDILVTKQKDRARQFWDECQRKNPEDMKDQINDDVVKHLNHGEVLPIFHTLCCPPDQRLFAPNTRVSVKDPNSDEIQLSAAPVVEGECNEGAEHIGKISIKDNQSYIPAFFQNDIGIEQVKDSNFTWEFDDDYTKIVTNLVNAPSKMVGEDIEVTKLVAPMAVDRKSGCNLMTRRLSRGVVADCFAKSEECSTYTMVGNPGIGKSWTLIYALQQALLYENACVMLCFQKDKMAIVCLRRNNRIYAWRSNDDRWENTCSSNLFFNSNVLVLLDPLESSKGGAAYSEGPRMLIIAASNNDEHFKSIGKFTGDYARILSYPSFEEMKCQLRFVPGNSKELLSLDVILERAAKVGNLLRYVRSETLFRERLDHTTRAITELRQNDVKSILNSKGTDQKNRTINGCIFAVKVNKQNEAVAESIDDPGEEIDESKVDENTGYDGQCVHDYGDRVLSIMCKHVFDEIVTLSRASILSFWGITSSGQRSEMGHIVENLFWGDLKKPNQMRIFQMRKGTKSKDASDMEAKEHNLDIGNCLHLHDILLNKASLGEKVFNASSPVVARMQKNEALIDFAGPYRRVYQVTVSANHSMSHTGLEQLFLASGHLDRREENGKLMELKESQYAKDIGNIEYYWVVPQERVADWKKRAPKVIRKQSVVGECLKKYVTQYILVMDEEPNECNANVVTI